MRLQKINRSITQKILLAFFLGLAAAGSIYNHFIRVQMPASAGRYLLAGGVGVMCVGLVYLLLGLVMPRLGRWSARNVALWTLGALTLALMMVTVLSPGIPVPQRQHVLEISATGKHNPAAQGGEVRLCEVNAPQGRLQPYDMAVGPGWLEKDNCLTNRGDAPAFIHYYFEGSEGAAVRLIFVTGPDGGQVRVRLDEDIRQVDLYEAQRAFSRVDLPVTYAPLTLALLYSLDGLSLSLLLWLAGILLQPLARVLLQVGRGLALRVGMVLLGCLMALLLAEVLLHFYNPFALRLQGDRINLPKNVVTEIQNPGIPGLDDTIIHTKNSLGFRGADPPLDFGRYFTIFAVGGSTTECYYISDGEDWPNRLGQLLGQKLGRVWINNAGISGQTSNGHLVLMRDVIRGFKPDMVIFLVGINDMMSNLPRRDEPALPDDAIGTGKLLEQSVPDLSPWERLLRSAAPYSTLANIVYNLTRAQEAQRLGLDFTRRVDITQSAQRIITDEEITRVLEQQRAYLPEYRQRIRRLVQLSRENGIEPVLVTQPVLYGAGVDDLTGVDLETIDLSSAHISRGGAAANGKQQWLVLELYNDVLREVGKEEGVLVVDLARKLPKSTRYFYDFMHYNKAGSQKVAEILFEEIEPYLKVHGLGKEKPAGSSPD